MEGWNNGFEHAERVDDILAEGRGYEIVDVGNIG
jgi:hypothetical protein